MTLRLKKPLIYVTRDIERALGMKPEGNYFIVSNDTSYGREVKEKYPQNIQLIAGNLDTYDLLCLPEVQETISNKKADVVVFQNTPRIERLAAEKGWNLLNPSADIAKKVEEKISQVAWLGADANLLPPHTIALVKDVHFEGKRFVLQFNHSHTGQGTYVIDSESQLAELREKFPNRECRVVDFIEGPVFTINVVVGRFIVRGSISYQITGLSPFTDLPFSTIGNDWSVACDKETINKISRRIGQRMRRNGWKGLFGIDVIFDQKSNKTYLLEINARQPASAVFESVLQKTNSIFEAHIAALLGRWTPFSVKQIEDGAQIVQRLTHAKHIVDLSALRQKGLTVMEYENDIYNKELFRIQSNASIMKSHNQLNPLGEFIRSCIR
jgi:predicted ATP-grasp superfamily ATP-dependent carboligase